jgi:hypothetical protein
MLSVSPCMQTKGSTNDHWRQKAWSWSMFYCWPQIDLRQHRSRRMHGAGDFSSCEVHIYIFILVNSYDRHVGPHTNLERTCRPSLLACTVARISVAKRGKDDRDGDRNMTDWPEALDAPLSKPLLGPPQCRRISIFFFGYLSRLCTSKKKGFYSSSLVPNVFGPWLKGSLVSIHLKMWASGH